MPRSAHLVRKLCRSRRRCNTTVHVHPAFEQDTYKRTMSHSPVCIALSRIIPYNIMAADARIYACLSSVFEKVFECELDVRMRRLQMPGYICGCSLQSLNEMYPGCKEQYGRQIGLKHGRVFNSSDGMNSLVGRMSTR